MEDTEGTGLMDVEGFTDTGAAVGIDYGLLL